MTRKDYVLIAKAVQTAVEQTNTDNDYRRGEQAGIALVVSALADSLGADNPRFDRKRFVKAALGI